MEIVRNIPTMHFDRKIRYQQAIAAPGHLDKCSSSLEAPNKTDMQLRLARGEHRYAVINKTSFNTIATFTSSSGKNFHRLNKMYQLLTQPPMCDP